MNIETLLHEEIVDRFQDLNRKGAGSEESKVAVDELTKLIDRAIEIEKIEVDSKEKAKNRELDRELKLKELEVDKKDRKMKNCLTGVSVVGGLVGAFAMGLISMKFERTDTLTTEAGRSSVRQLLKFKF